ncbi:hypothetical protein BC629DRAFT_1445642 [Irpex lacteus]|nr:hypothetical protein BC629DRAFT_1445642 [Irpex lacteus]
MHMSPSSTNKLTTRRAATTSGGAATKLLANQRSWKQKTQALQSRPHVSPVSLTTVTSPPAFKLSRTRTLGMNLDIPYTTIVFSLCYGHDCHLPRRCCAWTVGDGDPGTTGYGSDGLASTTATTTSTAPTAEPAGNVNAVGATTGGLGGGVGTVSASNYKEKPCTTKDCILFTIDEFPSVCMAQNASPCMAQEHARSLQASRDATYHTPARAITNVNAMAANIGNE